MNVHPLPADNACEKGENVVRGIFSASVSAFTSLAGRVRPCDGEHFGWRDGISQPAIKYVMIFDPKRRSQLDFASNNSGLVSKTQPGQRTVDPGVIVMGYKGDPALDNSSSVQRPTFTKDGSFMVFRKLEQDVLGFENYIDTNWKAIPATYGKHGENKLSKDERKALFGARMVGRFKTVSDASMNFQRV